MTVTEEKWKMTSQNLVDMNADVLRTLQKFKSVLISVPELQFSCIILYPYFQKSPFSRSPAILKRMMVRMLRFHKITCCKRRLRTLLEFWKQNCENHSERPFWTNRTIFFLRMATARSNSRVTWCFCFAAVILNRAYSSAGWLERQSKSSRGSTGHPAARG